MTDRRREPALDGLRALAVTAVVLFHGGVAWLPGGFLGVDVFFALSGFLITRLLLREWQDSGRIDLARFWARRMRRLLPALFVVVLVVVAVSAAHPHETAADRLRGDSLAALGYVANWRFAFTGGGYFAESAFPPALQHTWSLGVEEQFYVLWPLLLLLVLWRARRFRPRFAMPTVALLAVILAAGSAMLMAALFTPGGDAGRVYYGSDTRAQSILLGVALAAALGDRRLHAGRRATWLGSALGLAGLAAVAWSCVHYDAQSVGLYRGGFAVAAAGATAVIAAVVLLPDGALASSLGCLPLRALGRISYGVYLWHWPVLLAVTRETTNLVDTPLLLARINCTLALATASWWLVERPTQLRTRIGVGTAPAFLTAAALVAGVVALVAVPLTSVSAPVAVAAVEPASLMTLAPTTSPDPSVPPTQPRHGQGARHHHPATRPTASASDHVAPIRVTILGDSVAQSLGGLAPTAGRQSVTVANDAILGCGIATTPQFGFRGGTYALAGECASWESIWASDVAVTRPDVAVVLVGRHEVWDARYNGVWTHVGQPDYDSYLVGRLRRAVAIAGSTGAHVVVLTAPYFSQPDAPDGHPYPENEPERLTRWNALVRSAAAGRATVIDLGAKACPGGHYASTVDGVYLRSDGVHFSAAGVQWLSPWLVPQLRAAAS